MLEYPADYQAITWVAIESKGEEMAWYLPEVDRKRGKSIENEHVSVIKRWTVQLP